MFSALETWLLEFATSPWSVITLVATSFSEAIFFPIPIDGLLIAMGILQPNLAILFGVLATFSSVAGAVVGHWLGGKFGSSILHKLFSDSVLGKSETLLAKYGVWATVIAAFTPIPYKVFAVSAGALNLDLRRFVIASLVGRGIRFISIGILLFLFGESIEKFITKHFEIVTIIVGIAIILLLIVFGFWKKLAVYLRSNEKRYKH